MEICAYILSFDLRDGSISNLLFNNSTNYFLSNDNNNNIH